MARTIAQIYDSIIAEKNNQPTLSALQPAMDDEQTLLSDLTSSSKVAVWRLWAYIIAVQLWIHETIFDRFQQSVLDIIAKFRPGTLRWYQEQAFTFQYGHELEYINGKYQYATLDEAAKIVKRCSVSEPNRTVRIKVAKVVSGVLTELTNLELAAVDAYFRKIKYPGQIAVVSFSADLLKIEMEIWYNPMVDLPTLKTSVETAIKSYISELPFDGVFNLTSLTDKVQKVTGVIDPRLQLVEAKYGLLPYAPVLREYQTNAGYAIIDPANTLTTTLSYQPYV